MRATLLLLCALMGLAGAVRAEEATKLEVGTSMGVAFTFVDGEQVTRFGIPGAGTFLGLAALYFTTFPHPHVLVEPQLHLQVLAHDGDSDSVVSGMLQIGYLLGPNDAGSFYFAAHGGGLFLDTGGSETLPALGVAAGYRWQFARGGAVRLEARYRRWFDDPDDLDELAFTLGIGGVFR
jgi:hypothetical protein